MKKLRSLSVADVNFLMHSSLPIPVKLIDDPKPAHNRLWIVTSFSRDFKVDLILYKTDEIFVYKTPLEIKTMPIERYETTLDNIVFAPDTKKQRKAVMKHRNDQLLITDAFNDIKQELLKVIDERFDRELSVKTNQSRIPNRYEATFKRKADGHIYKISHLTRNFFDASLEFSRLMTNERWYLLSILPQQ